MKKVGSLSSGNARRGDVVVTATPPAAAFTLTGCRHSSRDAVPLRSAFLQQAGRRFRTRSESVEAAGGAGQRQRRRTVIRRLGLHLRLGRIPPKLGNDFKGSL